jgi:hypothetical protein
MHVAMNGRPQTVQNIFERYYMLDSSYTLVMVNVSWSIAPNNKRLVSKLTMVIKQVSGLAWLYCTLVYNYFVAHSDDKIRHRSTSN